MAPSNRWMEAFIFGLVLIVFLAVPVTAHGNYLSADSQISADGEILVEGVFSVTTGYVVLHEDSSGTIGDVIGYEKVAANTYLGSLSVSLNDSYWTNFTRSQPLWVVLHFDGDGDGEFSAEADPPVGGEDDPDHAVQISVDKGMESAYVLAETDHPQRVNDSTVRVRQLYLPSDGRVVIKSTSGESPNEPIGEKRLAAGLHRNVDISIDDHFYEHQPERFSLWAVLYITNTSGGDTTEAMRIEINGTPVASQFTVERTDPAETDHEHTSSQTQSPRTTEAPQDPPAQDAPTPTDDHYSPTITTNTASTPQEATQSEPDESPTPTTDGAPTASPGQPGFTSLTVVITMAILYLAFRHELE